MREIRTSGSEGGGTGYITGPSYPYQGRLAAARLLAAPLNTARSCGKTLQSSAAIML